MVKVKRQKLKWIVLLLCITIIAGAVHFISINKHLSVSDAIADSESMSQVTSHDFVDPKRVALTFDDGPHPYFTAPLLDGLKERNARATFFVLGKSAEMYPDLIQRMVAEGHLVGNHTYSHYQYTKRNIKRFEEEITKTNEILKEITELDCTYVRPPYGAYASGLEKKLDLFVVLWNVDPLDWKTENSDVVVKRVLDKVKDGDIILMHDVFKTSTKAALQIIDELQKQGYEFVTVEELMFD